jgi:hypothetical protein
MKSIEELTEELPNTRIWDDNKTLDFELPESNSTFIDQLIPFTCPKCDERIVKGNQDILRGLPVTIKGAQLTCSKCSLPMFIHEPVIG